MQHPTASLPFHIACCAMLRPHSTNRGADACGSRRPTSRLTTICMFPPLITASLLAANGAAAPSCHCPAPATSALVGLAQLALSGMLRTPTRRRTGSCPAACYPVRITVKREAHRAPATPRGRGDHGCCHASDALSGCSHAQSTATPGATAVAAYHAAGSVKSVTCRSSSG